MKKILISENERQKKQYGIIIKDLHYIAPQNVSLTQFDSNEEYLIVIPSLITTQSALSYKGVELALRIFINFVIKQNIKFRIIITSSEDKGSFFEHCKFANIIFSTNVYFVENQKSKIENLLDNLNYKPFASLKELINTLKNIKVNPPTAFKTAHTITNEWCIYRWSKALNINTDNSEIENDLYFSYLRAILSINEVKNINQQIQEIKAKILVIDDEINKGWQNFFSYLLKCNLKCIGDNFKNYSNSNQIIEESKKIIVDFDPDIVILDLRLHESDYNKRPEDLTGIKILNEIKKINKGIQVIGFTASNKVWNLLEWQKQGIDDFIVKESPEMSQEENYTKNALDRLENAINNASKKQYLKNICNKINKIKPLIISDILGNEEFDKSTSDYIKMIESSLFTTIQNLESAFLYSFLILESFASFYIEEGIKIKEKEYNFKFKNSNDWLYYYNPKNMTLDKTKKLKFNTKRIPYEPKFYNLLDYMGISINFVEFSKLIEVRNNFNHPNIETPSKINENNIINIIDIICKLIKNNKR